MKIDKLTPNRTILGELGERVARVRKRLGHSQEALAAEAGLGVATLRRMEDGEDARMGSWVKLLKALGMEAGIEALLPADFKSPMEEAKGQKSRKRANTKPGESKFRWGDEEA